MVVNALGKMSQKGSPWRIALNAVFAIVCLYLVGLGIYGYNQGKTIERIDSACARANTSNPSLRDLTECQGIRRQADLDQPLSDACIQIRRTFHPDAVAELTRCDRRK